MRFHFKAVTKTLFYRKQVVTLTQVQFDYKSMKQTF